MATPSKKTRARASSEPSEMTPADAKSDTGAKARAADAKPETTEAKLTDPKAIDSVKASVKRTPLRLDSAILSRLLGLKTEEFELLNSFASLPPEEKPQAARKIIHDSIINATELADARFTLAVNESESLLKGYATLDDPHRTEIQRLIKQIASYLADGTRKRPFNALMLAAPGAGKSHFIKQLAATMKGERVQAVTFNMATMQSAEDMAQPVDELRNLKVNDRFPLLFLDEFDSDPSRYAALLPLLWDGELQIGHRDLKLGKAVIVLAGSSPDLPKAMDQSAKMRIDTEPSATGKLVDLLSRINGGVINIPDLDLRSELRDRRVDKVCIAVGLVRARFGDEVSKLPRALLRFIAHTTFRYGVRSIAHLIDLIDSDALNNKTLRLQALGLPITSEAELQDSSLKLHLIDKDQGFGIASRWNEFSEDRTMVDLSDAPGLRYFADRELAHFIT